MAPGLFLFQGPHEETTKANLGGFANIGFVVGEDAVAVIDTGGSWRQGRLLLEAIRRITDLPIRYVILTHMHPDHIFGAAAFLDENPIFIGHRRMPQALAARGAFYLMNLQRDLGDLAEGTEVVFPTLMVDGAIELDLGNRILRLTARPTAHTDNDLSLFDVNTKTLWASDLLFIERMPIVDGSLKGWIAVLKELRKIDAQRVVPGHGPVSSNWPQALDAQERYFRILLSEIRAILARNGTIEQAVESVGTVERTKWRLFERYHPRNVVTVFQELEWE